MTMMVMAVFGNDHGGDGDGRGRQGRRTSVVGLAMSWAAVAVAGDSGTTVVRGTMVAEPVGAEVEAIGEGRDMKKTQIEA